MFTCVLAEVVWFAGTIIQIEKKAEEIRKAAPAMTCAEAIDKACIDNPDLVHQYEANR